MILLQNLKSCVVGQNLKQNNLICVILFSLLAISNKTVVSASQNGQYYQHLSFMCPDNPVTFCKDGTLPHEKTVSIHSEEIQSGNFSLNSTNFVEHRICVKSINDELITMIRCDVDHQNVSSHIDDDISNPTASNSILLRKCCRKNQRLMKTNSTESNEGYSCVNIINGSTWNPALFPKVELDFTKHIDLYDIIGKKNIVYAIGYPGCENRKMMNNYEDIVFKVLTTGNVFIGLKFWFRPVWLSVNNDRQNQSYCLDELELSDASTTTNEDNSHAMFHKNQVLVYCDIDRFDEYLFHRKLFGILCVSASCVILVLLIIYLSIYDRQNLAGWTQFNIFVAVFFVFGMEGIRTLVNYNGLDVKATFSCTIIAAIAQYFFFALNTTWCVMNFDLLWTFWKLESSGKGLHGKGRRVCAYLAFSWGLPLILIVVLFGIKHHEANESKEKMNGIYSEAHRRCSSPIREFGFQTQGVMFLCNVAFFAVTAFFIWKHRRGITNARRNTRSDTYRSSAVFGRVLLFGKLLVVMGVSSMTIPINYLFSSNDPLNPFEVLFRMVHFIPVVAILFIFGFNEKNLHLLKQKYPNFGNMMGISIFHLKPITTDTNQSPTSGARNSTEIR